MEQKYKKYLIYGYGFLGAVLLFLALKKNGLAASISQKKFLNPETEDTALSKKYNFHIIPDKKGNYRSAQIPASELPKVLNKYGIKRVIRLNGNTTSDSRGVPEATEKRICEQNGVEYIRMSSHEGYVRNQGYVKSVDKSKAILDKGNTLIHCAWGADRTGGLVGGYLKKSGIMTNDDQLWAYTTQYNNWMSKIRRGTFFGSGFDKYADCFYPIDKLKQKYN
jgi:protein-tyrosine phosphatase